MRTGLWIPVEIEALPLSLTEKVLFAEIVSLDRVGECFASNEHFSKLLGIRPDSVSRIISKLKKIGYLKQTGFDGRHRKLAPIIETKSATKSIPILSPMPTQTRDISKGRVGDIAEAAFAISQSSYKRVQLNTKVQKTFMEFKSWANRNLSQVSARVIEQSGNPEQLPDRYRIAWAKFAVG